MLELCVCVCVCVKIALQLLIDGRGDELFKSWRFALSSCCWYTHRCTEFNKYVYNLYS